MADEEPLRVPYTTEYFWEWSYGRISKFFRELKENKKILGSKCPRCGVTYCPPTSDCPKCYVPTEWVEVGPQGTIVGYTIVHAAPLWFGEKKIPYVAALIKLDGADTSVLHFVDEIDPDKVGNGMRVEAVFKEEREGYITDISHFKPI
jgi:hypothetical protein